ncbi:CLK4-associating serine/arginine rich protein [Schistosoma japonicum]|nr:CLK4-associating serine/arginine rich protein [Schistosoma japonicum]
MWQEARKQEKHIKTLMVDYKRRAERRRDYYERIKQDPIKFLRLCGRSSKLHLDSEVTKAAENPNNMMPWVGDPSIMIDRFDVRASLEHYDTHASDDIKLSSTERIEARLCNYERYRCLIHNEYASVTEAMALKQIEMDEKYGDMEKRRKEEEEASVKKAQESKAAIGFVYEDSTAYPSESSKTTLTQPSEPQDNYSDSDDEADSDMDIDVELDISTLTTEARRQLAKSAATFGLHPSDFVRLLDADQQLETELRLAKALEEEKLQLSGRKSRRSRRLLRERRAQEKFPRLLTTKIGLLNGQPISRRTVYLSASSSDSGDYPSDVEDQDFSGIVYGSPTSKAATIRAQRARAKPILSNARGPSVLIGGMTSISLCRRNKKQSGRGISSKYRSTSDRTSSSSEGSIRGRRSNSSDRSYSNRRSRSGFRRPRHSRVEYITTFGDNEDNIDNKKNDNGDSLRFGSDKHKSLFELSGSIDSKPPGSAASAVAASVVSKLLSSSQTSVIAKGKSSYHSTSSPKSTRIESRICSSSNLSDSRRRPQSRSRYRRSSSGSRSSSRQSHSSRVSRSRRRYHSRTRNSNSNRSYRSTYRRYKRSPDRYRSRRRSSSSRRSHSDSSTSIDNRKSSHDRVIGNPSARSYYNQTSLHESESVDTQLNAQKQPSPPVRKRYYRPELESADELELSDEEQYDGAKKESSKSSDGNSGKQLVSRKSDSIPYRNFAGKMTSQQLVTTYHGPSPIHDLKNPGVGGGDLPVRLQPQELLKRRVQSQLTKAFNADKKAELEKQIQLERERQAREEGLRRQARLLRRQEEKRLRAERRAMAMELGSAPDNSSDSSSNSSGSSGSRYHSSRIRSRRFQASPTHQQSLTHSSFSSGSQKYSPRPPTSTRCRPRPESGRGLLGSPTRIPDSRLPSPPSNSNLRRSFNSSSANYSRDEHGSIDRIPRTGNSLLGSPIQSSYFGSKDRSATVSSSSRFYGSRGEDQRYSSTRPYVSSRGELPRRSDQYSRSTDKWNQSLTGRSPNTDESNRISSTRSSIIIDNNNQTK